LKNEEANARLQEFEEHVEDLQEENEGSSKRARELETMVLDCKREINALMAQIIEKDRALALSRGDVEVREVLCKLETAEKEKLEQSLVLLDLREELQRVEKMAQSTNTALLRAEEELEAVRSQRQGVVQTRATSGASEVLARYENTIQQQQKHNVFLSRALDRLETEQQSVIAAKDKTVAFVLHSLKMVSAEMQALRRAVLLKDPTADAILAKQESIEDLRRQLFFSKAVACKIDRATRNLRTNLNVAELWEKARFVDTDQFDKIIMFELEGTGQSKKH
jgi:hypothetical protein